MATARKLPSGNWRALKYDYTDADGKRHYQSFTAPTRREAELMAAQYVGTGGSYKADMTFREAAETYVAQRSHVLSASTIREYTGYQNRYFRQLNDKRISKITQSDVQREINTLSASLAPKTVRNIHGFISAVLAAYRPDFALNTILPKKVPPKLYVPSEAEIQRLMAFVSGTEMELPVLLAAFGPMRRGEICALRSENISECVVHVCENMVLDKDNEWRVKTPKSYAGDRYIEYPVFVAEKWRDAPPGRIVKLYPANITDRFEVILRRAELPHFRFHDLRHYSASIQHALGVPDAYIMQRGGWKNDGVLKQVYRHTLAEKSMEMSRKVNDYFESMQHEMQHGKEKNT